MDFKGIYIKHRKPILVGTALITSIVLAYVLDKYMMKKINNPKLTKQKNNSSIS